MAGSATKIHVDSTYKIVFQGYPLIVLGVSDEDRHFHLVGLMLATSETQEDFEFLFKALLKGTQDTGRIIQPKAVVRIEPIF